jgi:hypothetical protein
MSTATGALIGGVAGLLGGVVLVGAVSRKGFKNLATGEGALGAGLVGVLGAAAGAFMGGGSAAASQGGGGGGGNYTAAPITGLPVSSPTPIPCTGTLTYDPNSDTWTCPDCTVVSDAAQCGTGAPRAKPKHGVPHKFREAGGLPGLGPKMRLMQPVPSPSPSPTSPAPSPTARA